MTRWKRRTRKRTKEVKEKYSSHYDKAFTSVFILPEPHGSHSSDGNSRPLSKFPACNSPTNTRITIQNLVIQFLRIHLSINEQRQTDRHILFVLFLWKPLIDTLVIPEGIREYLHFVLTEKRLLQELHTPASNPSTATLWRTLVWIVHLIEPPFCQVQKCE